MQAVKMDTAKVSLGTSAGLPGQLCAPARKQQRQRTNVAWRPHFQSRMDSHDEDQEFMLGSMNSANFEGKLVCSSQQVWVSSTKRNTFPLPELSTLLSVPPIHPAIYPPCDLFPQLLLQHPPDTGPVLPILNYAHLLIHCSYTAGQRPMQRVGKALHQAYSISVTQVIYYTHTSSAMNQNKTRES